MKSKQKVVASIEARMGSSRLPGKALVEIGGKPALQILIERISRCRFIDEIIIATTSHESDDKIAELGKKLNIYVHRGPVDDVLERVVGAVTAVNGDVIVEITGDCPLIDPLVIDFVVETFLSNYPEFDYVTNIGYVGNSIREIPIGMDVRVFTYKDLKHINEITNDPEDKEHVSLYFFRGGKDQYKLLNVETPDKWKRKYNPRLTLDTTEDLEVIKKIYENLTKEKHDFDLADILNFLDRNREILEINSSVVQKTVKDLE